MELKTKYEIIKIFAKTFEPEALGQTTQFANSVLGENAHIRIMPDAHAGAGCVIGTTMKITDKVCPNLVGVDIGCFTGDTKVCLLNGEIQSFKELENCGENVWVYSLDSNLKLVPALAVPKKTRHDADLVEVAISGGEKIRCTPDHEFMLSSGAYCKAENLKPFDSLMPLYRTYQTRDGYEHFSTKNDGGITHVRVASHFHEVKGKAVHHSDLKWYNNSPENLIVLTHSKHAELHRKIKTSFSDADFQNKKAKTIASRGYYFSEEHRETKRRVAVDNIKAYMDTNKFKEDCKNNGERGKIYLKKLNSPHKCEICGKICGNKGAYSEHVKAHKQNHKVLWVKKLDDKEDVYCLTVEKYHNFALACGVFVHNCGVDLVQTTIDFAKNLEKLDKTIRAKVPYGGAIHTKAKKRTDFSSLKCWDKLPKEVKDNAAKSLGTLGGGNHFMEAYEGGYLAVHSGSRNIGFNVAKYYQKQAVKQVRDNMMKVKMAQMATLPPEERDDWLKRVKEKQSEVKIDADLAYLTGNLMQDYLHDMKIMQAFAVENRKEMLRATVEAMDGEILKHITSTHNYIDFDDMILRKGAISARTGQELVIPLNMRDGLLICVGKGNEDWNYSAPHGAGRLYSRSKAKQAIKLEDYIETMKGVYSTCINANTIDESPFAYKDYKEILECIEPTVNIVERLIPIFNFKAD